MTLGDRITKGLAAFLDGELSVSVAPELTETTKTSKDAQIVVTCDSVNLYRHHLPGVYEVSGEIMIRKSMDAATPLSSFRSLCDQVCTLASDEETTPAKITENEPTVSIYNRQWRIAAQQEGSGESNGKRAFGAIYTWSCKAKEL